MKTHMFDNFLDYTRCPEIMLGPLLAECRNGLDLERSVHRSVPTFGTMSPSDGMNLLTAVQQFCAGNSNSATPADLDDVLNVLRLELYIDNAVQDENQSGAKSLVRHIYYMMRPLFPVSFRKYLQRIALRGWDSIPFPHWPVDLTTEEIIENTWKLLLRSQDVGEIPFIWFWPDGHSSGCIMTHDVEEKVGRDFCRTMMQIEQQNGITSSFEIVPEERYEVPEEFLQMIRSGGCEVCIHGLNHDGRLFSSEPLFRERAKKINGYAEKWGALGFRAPVLYRNLAWFRDLKFSYDMSVPNVGHLDPQRGGCCTVLPYFIGDIVELPLTTIQDYSLFHILKERSMDLWVKQMMMIMARNGLISFIVHPDYVTDQQSIKLYDDLLGYLAGLRSERGLWIALPREVDDWWRARHAMKLVNRHGKWKIVGPQAERARVAYASLREGRIVYSVEKESGACVETATSS